jgi:hypothetical protein
MNEANVDLRDVLERFEKVEKHNRQMKNAALTILLLLAFAVLVGSAGALPKVIEAEQFVIKDPNGKVRGRFGFLDRISEQKKQLIPGPALVLYSDEGRSLARLGTFGGVTGDLHLESSAGKQSTGLTSNMLFFLDDNSVSRVEVGIPQGKSPSLTVSDSAGQERTIVGVTQLVYKQSGIVDKRAASSLVLLDDVGNVIWSAP